MLSGFLVAGCVTVLACLVTMARIDIYKWLGYANWVDVIFTVMLITLFHGSFGGVVAAAFAGIFMSLSLWVLKSTLGYKRLRMVPCKWYKGCYRVRWVYYPPQHLSVAKHWLVSKLWRIA